MLGAQNPCGITHPNSQGVVFVIIGCRGVPQLTTFCTSFFPSPLLPSPQASFVCATPPPPQKLVRKLLFPKSRMAHLRKTMRLSLNYRALILSSGRLKFAKIGYNWPKRGVCVSHKAPCQTPVVLDPPKRHSSCPLPSL